MNIIHEKKLYKLGKTLYKQRKLDSYNSCMSSGFTCGDGWFIPLEKLTIKLELINKELKPFKFNIEAEQVKEKFGSLCFYFNLNEKVLLYEIPDGQHLCDNIISYIKRNNKLYYYKYIITKKIGFMKKPINTIIKFINYLYLKTKKNISKEEQIEYYKKVNQLIKEAQKECYNICEICGCSETENNKIIETSGWIRRICQKCNRQRNAKNV